MSKVVIDGIAIEKRDGECASPSCSEIIDWRKTDKPPPGWATLHLQRYTKKGIADATIVLCPLHTISFPARQPTLKEKTEGFIRTIIESPFAGNVEKNLAFLRACMRKCLLQGEAPFASHAIYTQPGVLDDNDPEERQRGIHAGLAWADVAQKIVTYTNHGISRGMESALARHRENGKVVEMRVLDGWGNAGSTSVLNEARENENR
jgi:hypothetical protein